MIDGKIYYLGNRRFQANISMSKNIVVFSDGTAKEGGLGTNTNVYKLFNMIEDRTVDQIAFYDRGLGTGLRKVTGSAFGVGISRNIQECYEFIFENYQSTDPKALGQASQSSCQPFS